MDLYTAELYLLSDQNDNFSKYNKKKILVDYGSNPNPGLFSHPCSSTAKDRCQVTLNLASVKPLAGAGRVLNNR